MQVDCSSSAARIIDCEGAAKAIAAKADSFPCFETGTIVDNTPRRRQQKSESIIPPSCDVLDFKSGLTRRRCITSSPRLPVKQKFSKNYFHIPVNSRVICAFFSYTCLRRNGEVQKRSLPSLLKSYAKFAECLELKSPDTRFLRYQLSLLIQFLLFGLLLFRKSSSRELRPCAKLMIEQRDIDITLLMEH